MSPLQSILLYTTLAGLALPVGGAIARIELGALLALLIGLQNLPEGFNSYREMTERGGMRAGRVLGALALAPVLGPVAGLLGFQFLADLPATTGIIMLTASGGILYLIFQDVAPQAKLSRHWGPPLGAVLGFSLGVAGHMILNP